MLQDSKGYTFVELTVVIVLIGLMLAIAFPRFRSALLTDNLKGSARRMIGMIRSLRDDAMRNQKVYDLRFDLDANRFWIDSPDMTEEEKMSVREKASPFPSDVHILDVWFREEGKKVAGDVGIRFNKKGYVQPSVIHMGSDDGRKFTLILSPFLRRIEVLEDYVEFEGI